MGGGCQVPMAAHAVLIQGVVSLDAAVVHPDGSPIIRQSYQGNDTRSVIGFDLANRMIELGAGEILKEVLGPTWEPGSSN
jgi:hydroxymethylbilane synthase